MKTFLLVAATAAVVVGGGVAAANHYDEYKNKEHKAQVSAVEAAKRAQFQADQKVVENLKQVNAVALAECQKGAAAYAKLAKLTKVLPPAPSCPVQ